MSLINDALKKARESQPANSSTAEGPTFQGEEVISLATPKQSSTNLLLALLSVVVLLLATLFFVQWYRVGTADMKVRANTKPWEGDVTSIKPPPVVHSPKPTMPATAPAVPAPETNSVSMVSRMTQAVTNFVDSVQPVKHEDVKFKLQSVFYRPGFSTVIINGKTLAVGELISGSRVVDIHPESATLVNMSGQTNVLELP